MNALKKRGLNQYGKISVGSEVEFASPHRLIQMLMAGALEKIATAKGFMVRGETAAKGEHISWAISIIGGLQSSLDMDAGGEIAQNLDDLYTYMARRLTEANMNDDPGGLDEVMSLLLEIKGAWDVMPESVKNTSSQTNGVTTAVEL
jgi:flagellar protein FliS